MKNFDVNAWDFFEIYIRFKNVDFFHYATVDANHLEKSKKYLENHGIEYRIEKEK